ncbi:MAG TPA: phytoene/squalene synthase family protein [Bryobacteraceae bacterium]|nr:phytoene/squalene synthase family protein [Bryobacteraceae bacterium]HPU73967.1 phytoene/squalene synthase family protein [Bryobacteraceae bacterium]
MNETLQRSYEYCRQVARSRARNFYYSFVLLPKPQRQAICAIYAFMRRCDDLSDDAPRDGCPRKAALERWREELDCALEGRFSGHIGWPAFHDTVQRFRIPREYFRDMIEGVMSDLQPRRIQTFDELYRYCYQVASVVGLTVIHIFGFKSPDALPLAEKCGVAFQLTNILRDVREDAARGRVYLPAEDLERFHVDVADLREGKRTDEFVALMEFEAARARAYYDESRPLIDMVDEHCRSSLWALIEIYSRLLARIEQTNYDVLSQRVELPAREKLWIIAKAALGARG